MQEKLRKYLSAEVYDAATAEDTEMLSEIRLRVGQAVCLRYPGKNKMLDLKVTQAMVSETLRLFCGNSLYAYADDIARGFVTVEGLRVGIGGRVVFSDGESRGIKTVSSLNIRIPRQVFGCADKLMPYITKNGGVLNTMIVSPPLCGKTTLLRDAVRQLSNSGLNTSIIDERGEIACLDGSGAAGNDVGCCTDILSGCGKAAGIAMALRSLAPELIALDEAGGSEDAQAINSAVTGGAAVICTVHSDSPEALERKKYTAELLSDGLFERIVFLRGLGEIAAIYDGERKRIC